jgi:hypothetical protein
MPPFLLWIAVSLLVLTSSGLLLSREWRWSLALLAGQYFAAFWLIYSHWPLTMSAAKLITGWMAAATLGMAQNNITNDPYTETSWPQGRVFRVFSAGLVLVAVFASAQGVANWLPDAGLPVITGALILIGLGLLHLGMTAHPLRVILGLLTILLGFETLYSAVENSILVAGLLSVINLGLALAGSYLLSLDVPESAQ